MKLHGMHHLTMITGDATRNVEFYADVLGLRLVKQTVNFDAPDAYHLYFGDEQGSPGSILTWFEFAGARRGRAGAGMIHTIQLGVASGDVARLLGRSARGQGLRERARRAARWPSRTTTGCASSSSWRTTATRRCAPSTPTCRPSTRSSASRARARTSPAGLDADRELLTGTLGFTEVGARRVPPRRRGAPLPLGLRRGARSAACRAPAPCTTSPGTRATRTTPPGSSAPPRPACT